MLDRIIFYTKPSVCGINRVYSSLHLQVDVSIASLLDFLKIFLSPQVQFEVK